MLAEGVPITSLEKIVESAIYHGATIKNVNELTERVRASIGHLICEPFRGDDGRVRVMICEPRLEHFLRQSMQENALTVPPATLEKLIVKIQSVWETARIKNESIALLVDSTIRFGLRQAIFRSLKDVSVIAYNEVPSNIVIDAQTMIRFDDVVGSEDLTSELASMMNEGES